MKKLRFLLMSVVMIFAVISCDKNDEMLNSGEYDSLLKTASVEGVFLEDFVVGDAESECAQVLCDGEYSFKIEAIGEGIDDGEYVAEGGNTITILNSEEKVFDWESEWPVCAVIVKGGTGAVVYYMDGATSGTGFLAPENDKNGKAYGVSHVTFCYDMPVEKEPVIIAIKARYVAGTVGDELLGPYYLGAGLKNYSLSEGTYIFTGASCKSLGYNEYPGTSEFLLSDFSYGDPVGYITVSEGVGDITITVKLKGDGQLIETRFFVGSSEEDLLSSVPIGEECPDYFNTDFWFIDYTAANSVSYTVPY